MTWRDLTGRKLHLRIWLIVAGSVIALCLIVGVAWHFNAQASLSEPAHGEITLRQTNGAVLQSTTESVRRLRGGGLEFNADLDGSGAQLPIEVQIKPHTANEDIWDGDKQWLHPPYSLWWVLILAGATIMVCVYPLTRHLTRRLETLQSNLERWGRGELSMRFSVSGNDEVADLAAHMNVAADRINALIESQKSLLTHASHELRSPLARIRMALDLALNSDAARQRARAEILHNLDELDEIIENILLASRLEIRPGLFDAEPVDLIGLLAEECARTGAAFDVAPEVTANLANSVVQGSLLLLRRAVRNLLENAVQHGKRADGQAETSVLLECEATGDHAALIQVDDRGPGVPANQRQYIFEPFYSLPGTGKRGFGLGLALVQTIAERHGGSITYSDREGGGARFTLRLPHQIPPPA